MSTVILERNSLTKENFLCYYIPAMRNNDIDKKLIELRGKLREATIKADRAEARAIKAVRVIRNMKEAKAGLERAINIW